MRSAPTGILFIVSAPSGAGKTSLVNALLEADARLRVCISHTTRRRRPKEVAGVNYHFVSTQEFQAMVAAGAFLEHAEVFGNHYGTARESVSAELAAGNDLVLEIDWQGAALVRAARPDAVSIFIVPPSQETLRERLKNRAQDDADVIESRLAAAKSEMAHHGDFNYLVINDDFDIALEELKCIVRAERCREPRQALANAQLLEALLNGP